MKLDSCCKIPVFEFDDYTRKFELSQKARMLLAELQDRSECSRQNYLGDGIIPLDYEELSDDLECSKDVIKKCFVELEEHGFVSRCVARFVQIKKNKEV